MLCAWFIIRWYQCCFMWVSSHVGLAGNSATDSAAKARLLLPVSNFTVPHSNYNSLIRTQALQQWNSDSSEHAACDWTKGEYYQSTCMRIPRRDEILIQRLRIGHTYFTHGHLRRGETPPRCSACQIQLTVEHILLDCVSLTNSGDNVLLWPLCLHDMYSKVYLS